jgi:AAA+ superfamily predicted ATPase
LDEKNDIGTMEITDIQIATALEKEIVWFEEVTHTSLTIYFENGNQSESVAILPPPTVDPEDDSAYSVFLKQHALTFQERLVLILSLLPYLKPQSLDVFMTKNTLFNTEYTEFGGFKDSGKNGFFPTLDTACFVLTGTDLGKRLQFINTFDEKHLFYAQEILVFDAEKEFSHTQKLQISTEYLNYFISGKTSLPQFNSKFPAKEIKTQQEWTDLIVEEGVQHDLTEIQEWLLHSQLILNEWNLSKELKPGYRALFYGPPGTGKTLAATLLGKATGRPVFRVDLSLVVSKYIGETEKNLGRLFDEAQSKEWILFFDEADALFGKRTQTKGSNDRYANQEVAYLLQRIEDFPGLVILATNLQTNIDEAFSRRFQSTVYFPKPKIKERKRLWDKLLFDNFETEETDKAHAEIEKYELSGGEMINVLRYCAIQAAKRNEKKINLVDIITGIKREYNKSNKTL